MNKRAYRFFSLLLILLLLFSAAPAALAEEAEAPSPWEVEEPPIEVPEYGSIGVSTVDQLLGAIAPGTTVVLSPGVYNLSEAADYGGKESEWYYWEEVYDGYQLVLRDMSGLQIVAPEGAEIVTEPRYANVLAVRNCDQLLLAGLTLGHTEIPGYCTGGVVFLHNCSGVALRSCKLYGCGVVGIDAAYCEDLSVSFTEIYECSLWGLCLYGCERAAVEDCWIHDCGDTESGPGILVFSVNNCRNVAVLNTRVTGNTMGSLLESRDSVGYGLLGCTVEENRFQGPLLSFDGEGAMIDDCSFSNAGGTSYYEVNSGTVFAHNRDGEELISFDLDRMERSRVSDTLPILPEESMPEPSQEEMSTVRVSDVDELLAAIAPNTRILLEPGDYDLSSAAGYGGQGSQWYSWEQRYDGPSLVVADVPNLSLVGSGRGLTRILAHPRYATVLGFHRCDNLQLFGLTAGHVDGQGECVGNVVDLIACRAATIDDCGFFGCGMIGVMGENSRGIQIRNTDLYACSDSAAFFDSCKEISFDQCSIYGCQYGNDRIVLLGATALWNGEALAAGTHFFSYREYVGTRSSR